ncbi:MAG TPA: DUF2062 domain-containing protein [bacterium]|nr:DUF2062 domain-containing protein [bacterium]
MLKYFPKKFLELIVKLLKSHSTTQEIADGMAIGVFVSWLPILGIHMPLSFILATLFKKNPWIAMLAAWIVNPLTMLPIYWFNFWVGKQLYHKQLLGFPSDQQVPAFDFHHIFTASKDILIPLIIGSVVVGVVAAFVSQCLCLRYYDRLKLKFVHFTHHIEAHLHLHKK